METGLDYKHFIPTGFTCRRRVRGVACGENGLERDSSLSAEIPPEES